MIHSSTFLEVDHLHRRERNMYTAAIENKRCLFECLWDLTGLYIFSQISVGVGTLSSKNLSHGGSVVKNPPVNAGARADAVSVSGWRRSLGEGNGNSLQCSCLENSRDRGAWWAAVSGVAQSQTQLKRLSSSSSSNKNQFQTYFQKKTTQIMLSYTFIWILKKSVHLCRSSHHIQQSNMTITLLILVNKKILF